MIDSLIQLGIGGASLWVLYKLGVRAIDAYAPVLQSIASTCNRTSESCARIEGKLGTAPPAAPTPAAASSRAA